MLRIKLATHLINTDFVEHVFALDQLPRLLVHFEITQADETARTGNKVDCLLTLNSFSYKSTGITTYPEKAWSRSHILLTRDGWFGRSEYR